MNKMKTWIIKSLSVLTLAGSLLFLTGCEDSQKDPDYFTLNNYINDYADIFDEQTEKTLNTLAKEQYEQEGIQFVTVTTDGLDGEEIHDAANTIFNENKLGNEDEDKGILLLIDMDEREFWMEIGDGLEGDLTDIITKRLLENYLVPDFKDDNYDEGITSLYTHTYDYLKAPYELKEAKEEDSLTPKQVILLVGGIFAAVGAVFALVFWIISKQGIYLQTGQSYEINPSKKKGSYTIYSKKPNIVSVSGMIITALQPGKARLVVTRYSKKGKKKGTFEIPVFVDKKEKTQEENDRMTDAFFNGSIQINASGAAFPGMSSHGGSGGFSSGGFSGGGGSSSGGGAGGSF